MGADNLSASGGELQFDRAVANGAAAQEGAGVVCSACGTSIRTAYFAAGDATICGTCKVKLEMGEAAARRWPTLGKAALFGLGASIAGAGLYYAVIAITGFEIGLVAIATGFMVGWAVRKGSGGYGSRRFQVLALALTYFSVGLAYMPLAIKGAVDSAKAAKVAVDSTAVDHAATDVAGEADEDLAAVSVDSAATPGVGADSKTDGEMGFFKLVGQFVFFVFALPVMAILGTLPSGLISALIIGFGMQQAWRMTGDSRARITGPHRVGGRSNIAAA